MSEKIRVHEDLLPSAEHELLTAHATPEKNVEKTPEINPEKARQAVAETVRAEHQPNPLEQLKAAEKASDPAVSRHQVSRELRQVTLQRELQNIRRNLPRPRRALSQLIHQPAVRMVSEAAGRTVSRPSGLLGGGLTAFIGTTGYLYLAHHIGLTYNYLVFLILLAGGFALGVGLEGLVYLTTRSRRSHD
jgi:hypothetical protein